MARPRAYRLGPVPAANVVPFRQRDLLALSPEAQRIRACIERIVGINDHIEGGR